MKLISIRVYSVTMHIFTLILLEIPMPMPATVTHQNTFDFFVENKDWEKKRSLVFVVCKKIKIIVIDLRIINSLFLSHNDQIIMKNI